MRHDQEWTQEELRAHLSSEGFDLATLEPGEIIPQYLKFAKFAPPTQEDIDWARSQASPTPSTTKEGVKHDSTD